MCIIIIFTMIVKSIAVSDGDPLNKKYNGSSGIIKYRIWIVLR